MKTISIVILCFLSVFEIMAQPQKKTPQNPSQYPGYNANQSTTVSDIDGNVYHTVIIGTQTWLVENLKTTKYNDGSDIPLLADSAAWIKLTTSAYCWYNNDINNKIAYGALYNFYAINTDKLCPTGWHVSRESEWEDLINFLGGEDVAGGKLKETGTIHWESSDGVNNSSKFTALPGGRRTSYGSFDAKGQYGFWGIIVENTFGGEDNSSYIIMYYKDNTVEWGVPNKQTGSTVRCVKD